MPRIMDPTFVPTGAKGGPVLLTLDQIPDEVKAEVEAIYVGLKANPNGRMRVAFDTADEVKLYELQVKSYCEQRPEGVIRYRRSPSRGLPDNAIDFRISDPWDEKPVTAGVASGAGFPVPPTATVGKRK